MEVWFLDMESDTQVCSSLEKAIDAAKAAYSQYASDIRVEEVCEDGEEVRVCISYIVRIRRIIDSVRITRFVIDGGPVS